jgi:hypothetical protein
LLPQPEGWPDEFHDETKRHAERVMAIFDLAPPRVRERTRLNPEGMDLVWWWQTQTEWKIDQGKIIRRV